MVALTNRKQFVGNSPCEQKKSQHEFIIFSVGPVRIKETVFNLFVLHRPMSFFDMGVDAS